MHKNAQKINVNGHTRSIRYYKSLYNENTKRPTLEDIQLGISKIYAFCWKIQQGISGLGDSTAGFTYLSLRIHSKI